MKELPLEIIELALSKRITLNPKILALIKCIALNPNDVTRKNQLMRLITPELLYNKLFGSPFIPYPSQEELEGELILGLLPMTIYFKLPVDSLTRHILISGSTGTGKTNLAYLLIYELKRNSRKFLSIGLKRDIRHLIKQIPLLVLRCNEEANFRWNILAAPPGVTPTTWDNILIKILSESRFLREGAESLLLDCLNLLRKRSDKVNIFTLYDFITQQKLRTFRGTNWKASILNRMHALIITFGKMLNTFEPIHLEKLVELYNLEFELDRAGEFKSFFASLISVYLFLHRISNNLRGNQLKNAILIDEVNLLASKAMLKSSSFGDITLLQIMQVGREFGQGFVFFTNEPSALADSIKAQASVKILLRQSHWPDVETMGKSMNLTPEQMAYSTNMPPGQSIVKIPGLQPFPANFPLIELNKDITDEEIDINNENLLRGTEFEVLIRFDTENSFEIRENLEENESNESQENEITHEERIFLTDIYNRPFISITERYQSLTIGG